MLLRRKHAIYCMYVLFIFSTHLMDKNATQHHGMCETLCGNSHWAYIVIKILVALFIFWAGVQFGELKAMIHQNYGGDRMMGTYEDRNWRMFDTPIMMYGTESVSTTSASR